MKIKLIALLFIIYSCQSKDEEDPFNTDYIWDSMYVTATAYNSLANQTSSDPHITAWGDSIRPGLKYIAVSRDLLKMGLTYNTPVKIDGFEGVYFVKDKMHSRWRKRIDIYMGLNVKAAKAWGRRKVCIDYGIKK